MSEERTETAFSAGGVVYRIRNGVPEFVMVGRCYRDFWALPKGGPNPGESCEETAIREVAEESGIIAEIDEQLETIHYSFSSCGVRYEKSVRFYLMRAVGGDMADHDHEYDFVAWFTLEEALAKATYESERLVIEKAAALLDDRPR